jgi:PIN domain-containing protein
VDSFGGKNRHPFIDSDSIIERIKKIFSKIKGELDSLQNEHPDLKEDDPIKDSITSLFSGRVGPKYSPDRLKEIYKEGRIRYKNKIPPGFRDEKNKPLDSQKYGDLVLWHQIIDMAKENEKPVILITDDLKGDWWQKRNGKTIGPHPDLINEFHENSKFTFYMYSTDPFMKHAKNYYNIELDQDAIDEVKEIREHDENELKVMEPIHASMSGNISPLTMFSDGAFNEAMEKALGGDRAIKEAMERALRGDRAIKEAMERALGGDRAIKEAMERALRGDRAFNEAMERALGGDRAFMDRALGIEGQFKAPTDNDPDE